MIKERKIFAYCLSTKGFEKWVNYEIMDIWSFEKIWELWNQKDNMLVIDASMHNIEKYPTKNQRL